jgi:hypothetical protein
LSNIGKEVKVKTAIAIVLFIAMSLSFGTAEACSVLNKKKASRGLGKGFQGECSNSGYSVTCLLEEGSWVICDGYGGSYSGTDLNSLIRSACRCTAQGERRKDLIEQMKGY